MKKWKHITASVVAAAALVGCGSSDSSSSNDTTQTGTFVDAPVVGLSYQTPSISGQTDSKGQFKYKEGESVTFTLGSTVIGSVSGAALITPKSFGDATKAANLAYILQNLDTDGDATNDIIKLPPMDVIKTYLSQLDIKELKLEDSTAVQALVTGLKTHITSQLDVALPDVDLQTALSNMEKNIADAVKSAYVKATPALIEGKNFHALVLNPAGLPSEEHTIIFSNGRIKTDGEQESSSTYEITKEGLIAIQWGDEEGNDYWKILQNKEGVLYIATDEMSKDAVLKWTTPDLYLSTDVNKLNAIKQQILAAKKATKIDPRTLKEKMLYRFNYWNDHAAIEAIQITQDDKIKHYYDSTAYDSMTMHEDSDSDTDSYTVSYTSDGKLQIVENGEEEEDSVYVYKIDLSGKTYDLNTFLMMEFEDDDRFDSLKRDMTEHIGSSVTFSKGAAYCTVLWDECWFDKDAMEDIISQANN